jgi:hypothetical protein
MPCPLGYVGCGIDSLKSIPGLFKSSSLFIYYPILTNWFLLGDGKVEVGPGVVDGDGAPLYLKIYIFFL